VTFVSVGQINDFTPGQGKMVTVNGRHVALFRLGNDFFALNLRAARAFRIGGDVKLEGLVEGFNVTNRVNNLTRNTNFGSGAYPTNPVSTFNQITAVGDPRMFQFGLRLTF